MEGLTQHCFDAVTPETTICWLRRDLRLEDNAALFYALRESTKVLVLFIFDTDILDKLEDKHDRRVEFIYKSIVLLKKQLESFGSSLLVFYGKPVAFFKNIQANAVYTNHDYEPYAAERDRAVQITLEKKNISFRTFKDHVIFEKSEVVKRDGEPYTVFTPYSRVWNERLKAVGLKTFPSEKNLINLQKITPLSLPTLSAIGFSETGTEFSERIINGSIITSYESRRNFPAIAGTSRLSAHLRFGTVSIRKLVNIALKKSTTWLTELVWREFYQMILWHFPQVVHQSFKPAYDRIAWLNNAAEFTAWCEGKTGYPLVDAGMRELNETGFMHNRVRMVTASFLTKHLLIDWRLGEAYFAKKLLDYDLASNNGGWQWAAGCGCDAAPYFRIFNPIAQATKFDSKNEYIKKWVPEFGTRAYAAPIVDHKFARERAIKTYQDAIK